jgi:hypothetical protein
MKNIVEILRPNLNNAFPFDSLMDSIGQAVVETQLRTFGYEVYPYIYEKDRTSVNGSMARGYSDIATPKVKSMPNLQVYDRESDESFLLHVKTTFGTDETGYWINKNKFDSYKMYWPETFLAIYFISNATIRCCKIRDIWDLTEETIQKIPEPGYHLSLLDFSDLPHCFPRIKYQRFFETSMVIQDVFKVFSYASN